MYNLVYLPAARRDMVEIVQYIGKNLKNPSAANHLAEALVEAADSILKFPYASPAYIPIKPLKHEDRKLVQNYLIFYWVDEQRKCVTIARVIYAKREYELLLE